MTFTQNLRGRLRPQGRHVSVCVSVSAAVAWPRDIAAVSPVTLPGVTHVWVADLPFVSLLIQEVKHVFDSQWEGRSSVGGAKHRFKEVVHKLLQGPLRAAGAEQHVRTSPPPWRSQRRRRLAC